jgi:CBS domain-containing protein
MPQTVNEVMTPDPVTCEATASLEDVARAMRDNDTGAIVVTDGEKFAGLVTDRDIVVRAVAEGREPGTPVRDAVSENVVSVEPDAPVERAIEIMREQAVRRVPVVQDGRPVGVVAIGDLAIERDGTSALADISAASPNS